MHRLTCHESRPYVVGGAAHGTVTVTSVVHEGSKWRVRVVASARQFGLDTEFDLPVIRTHGRYFVCP